MKGVVLAAGQGKRLRPYTDHLPKSMVEVAGHPFLAYTLSRFKAAGVWEIQIVTGYLAKKVETYFEDGSRIGLKLSYVRQSKLGGTAPALLLTERFVDDTPFMFGWGDILSKPAEYRRLADMFQRWQPDALLALNYLEDPSAGAAVYREGDRIVRIVEKPPPGTSTSHWNQAGIFVLTSKIFPYLRKVPISSRGEREFTTAIQMMIEEGHSVHGMELRERWVEMGRPEDLGTLDQILSQKGWGVDIGVDSYRHDG